MGFACNYLIPAAILLDNPGITREEFVILLDQTRSTTTGHPEDYARRIKRSRWDTYYPELETGEYHQGLHGLARILSLKNRDEYLELQEPVEEHGLKIHPSYLAVEPYKRRGKWMPPRFMVNHEKCVLSDVVETHEHSYERLSKGEVFSDAPYGFGLMQVENILKEKHIPKKKSDDDNLNDYMPYFYHLQVRYIRLKVQSEKFSTLDELVRAYPKFDPDFMYDFSQEQGSFSHPGFWRKSGNRYYLDEKTFDGRITNLILTAEAIRHRAWKLLNYSAMYKLMSAFLRKFPDSAARYEKAVWDAVTSEMAARDKMTCTEFLRWRLEASVKR